MAAEEPAKYRQIASELRARIRSGEFEPGARLPSKTALMDKHQVALGTVNDALNVLRDEGLLYTERGRGTFVCDPLPEEAQSQLEAALSRVDDLAERVAAVEQALAELRESIVLREVTADKSVLVRIKREVQDHARLLARMRQALEKAGITLVGADQQDEHAILGSWPWVK